MTVRVTAPAAALLLGADVLDRSIIRGDWDDEFSDEMAVVAGAFRRAAGQYDMQNPNTPTGTTLLDESLADEAFAVLLCDAKAATDLRPLLQAMTAGFAVTD